MLQDLVQMWTVEQSMGCSTVTVLVVIISIEGLLVQWIGLGMGQINRVSIAESWAWFKSNMQ